jgi:hypothetical protein
MTESNGSMSLSGSSETRILWRHIPKLSIRLNFFRIHDDRIEWKHVSEWIIRDTNPLEAYSQAFYPTQFFQKTCPEIDMLPKGRLWKIAEPSWMLCQFVAESGEWRIGFFADKILPLRRFA